MQLIPGDIHLQRPSTGRFPQTSATNYHRTRKGKADRDFKRKIAGMETDESNFRRLTSKYMSSFVIAHPEGNQAAPVTANKTDSPSNEYQGSLTRHNL
jgi:hypothetical protein